MASVKKTKSKATSKTHPSYTKALKALGKSDSKEVDLGENSRAVLGKVEHADGTCTISVSLVKGARSEVWVLNPNSACGFTNLIRQAEPQGDLDKVLEKALAAE
jgi:hypothetical protein